MKEIILNVDGMVCQGCKKRIENALTDQKNIKEVMADYKEGKVIIKADENIDLDEIKQIILDLDFKIKEG